MALKVKKGSKGALTILVPKADEVYDAEDGQLYIPCETTRSELAAAVRNAPEAVEPDEDAS